QRERRINELLVILHYTLDQINECAENGWTRQNTRYEDPPPTEIYTLSLHDALPISSTYISPLSNSTPCIRKDRISSKSLMRLSICLWKPSIGDCERVEMPQASIAGLRASIRSKSK